MPLLGENLQTLCDVNIWQHQNNGYYTIAVAVWINSEDNEFMWEFSEQNVWKI